MTQILPHCKLPEHSCFTMEDILNIINFSVDNCIVNVANKLYRQTTGVPMGDPLSPPIAIMVATMFEFQWLQKQPHHTNQHMQIRRYIDDIIALHTNDRHAHVAVKSFANNCYPNPPWTLETSKNNCFLETVITCGKEGAGHSCCRHIIVTLRT